MKHKYKSQLNLTGLSNVSEINSSLMNIYGEPNVEQSVLFGKNFVDQHEPTQSEVSLFKIQPTDVEEETKESELKQGYDSTKNFSMSKQIEEFKKRIELEESQNKSNKYQEKANINKYEEEIDSKDNNNEDIKSKDNKSTKFGEENIKLTNSFEENLNKDNIRDTEINMQWDDMIRQATDAPVRK